MNKSLTYVLVAAVLVATVSTAAPLLGQAPPPDMPPPAAAPAAAVPPAAQPPAGAPAEPPANTFSAEQLEQMVSPIALYPDALAMQILMAATYPLEVVEADRWVKKYPNLKSEELEKALAEKKWDPSVKSLTHFPAVLTRMSDNLDWTRDMGDAFLAQQKEVLDAIQRMRQKAYELGNLKSTPEQKVIVEPAPPKAETVVVQQAPAQIIKIEPAQPEVVYVPTYSSTVVYGPPPPTVYYPTMYAYPPGYVATASLLSFGAGMAVGAALWSDCDWGHGDVNVDVDTNRNVNRNVDRSKINAPNRQRPEQWKHNPEHRKGVNYRNEATAKKYGGQASDRARRDNARGYQRPSGAQQRPSGGQQRPGSVASARPARGASGPGADIGSRPQPSTRERGGQGFDAGRAGANRPSQRDTAFGGARASGRAENVASARGASSRGVDRGNFARDSGGIGGRGGGGFSGRGGGGGGGRGGGGGGRGRR